MDANEAILLYGVIWCSSLRYDGGHDAGGEQMWFGEYKVGERWGREKPCGSGRIVFHGNVCVGLHQREDGIRDGYSRDIQQREQEGPQLRYLQGRVVGEQGEPRQQWPCYIQAKSVLFFLLFQMICTAMHHIQLSFVTSPQFLFCCFIN